MLGINVIYTMKDQEGSRENFLLGASEVRQEVRKEEGCLQYDYFLPVDSPDQVLLVEKWTGPEAQKAHTAQPHMKKLARLKERWVQDVFLERYELEDR